MEDRRTFIPQEPLLRRPHGAIPGRTWRTEHPVLGTPPWSGLFLHGIFLPFFRASSKPCSKQVQEF